MEFVDFFIFFVDFFIFLVTSWIFLFFWDFFIFFVDFFIFFGNFVDFFIFFEIFLFFLGVRGFFIFLVTSVVLFNIGPVTPNRINGLFDSVTKQRQIPSVVVLNYLFGVSKNSQLPFLASFLV